MLRPAYINFARRSRRLKEIMTEVLESPVAGKLQTIILKEGCWVKTSSGFRRMRQRLETEATPILSGSEVVGFRFDNVSYRGVSHDLEKIIVGAKGEK